ncbi:MAG TPA: LL-diaminopimelate aminotransferase [Candidatus Saccharimonadales bacterium]|nr:LL-diaminopimelate aminotransferase [Candidatus Saccharimonadales bacterium]
MAKINQNYKKLQAGYLFPEIAKRTRKFQEKNPDVELIRLGIGDTTRPLTPSVVKRLHAKVNELADAKTYSGYGDVHGEPELRDVLAKYYERYGAEVKTDEVFVSDGAKSDTANIQSIFSAEARIAVQDPVYPVYVDSAVIGGKTTGYKEGRYEGIIYMDCSEENGFFPDLPDEKADLIYLCSPNNPTGAVATHDQLKLFVDYARENGAVIIFDAAYAAFISDDSLPRSIYEIEGAKECAIEVNSFSKLAGFTGVRLGWTVVPHELRTETSDPGEIRAVWSRRQSTMFNEASNIAQAGGAAVLSEEGLAETQELVDYYMENAKVINDGLKEIGLVTFGGVNAPYIWAKTPEGIDSWQFFDKLMDEAHVVGTPGAGFGRMGEGYFRLSAFGHKENIEKAMDNIRNNLKI